MSDWEAAAIPDDETLRLIIQLVLEWERNTGQIMTAAQLRAALLRPS